MYVNVCRLYDSVMHTDFFYVDLVPSSLDVVYTKCIIWMNKSDNLDYTMCAFSTASSADLHLTSQLEYLSFRRRSNKERTGYDGKDTHSKILRDHQEYRTQKIYIGSDIRTSPVPESPRNS